MPTTIGNGHRGGPPGRGPGPGSELEQLIGQGQERLKQIMPGGGPRSVIIAAILAALVVGAWTAYYTVPSDSVAVVQRFGKYLKEVQPGLHFKFPVGIDVATIVPVKRQLKQEFGFTTPGATDPYQSPVDGKRETEMVTGDLNAALVEWVVQYRISDPVKYLFEVREPGATLRYVSESVMREVVGDRTVDEVITIGRQEIETEALAKMQALSTKYEMGISIDQVQLKNINPPQPVQESFNEVNQAQQEKEKLINEARRDYNKVIPLAEGEKDQRIRGVADAKATEIYAKAYNQSPEAVAFYEFTRTMQAYKSIIEENTTLVLSTDSDLFKFLKGMDPGGDAASLPGSGEKQ